MDEVDFEIELSYGNVEYIFNLSCFKMSAFDSQFRMIMDVESKSDGHIWRGDYQ
jgi:hypothetical protein